MQEICGPHSEKLSFEGNRAEVKISLRCRWNTGSFSWNVPRGILDSSLMTPSPVILHRHTCNIKRTGNECREGDRSLAHADGPSLCLGNVSRQGTRYAGTPRSGEPAPVSNAGKACWSPATAPQPAPARKRWAAHRASFRLLQLESGLCLPPARTDQGSRWGRGSGSTSLSLSYRHCFCCSPHGRISAIQS